MKRTVFVAWALLAALGASRAEAGLWQSIYRGLDLAATPSGFPVFTTGDGTQVNGSRSGRLRIVPSGIGPGYELQFDRSFGPDSTGRAETFYLGGVGELTLQGSTQATLGYTGDKFISGHATVSANNLSYIVRSKVGVQDAELNGTLRVFGDMDVNMLGFYDINLNVANTDSQLTLDGVVIRDVDDTNFDIGPIVVQGNVFFDATLALLTALGVDTSELESIMPGSPIDSINDTIQEQLQSSQVVAGDTATSDFAPLLLETVFDHDAQAAQDLIEGLAADAESQLSIEPEQAERSIIPEPGTLLILTAGGFAVWCQRRRR